MTLQPGEILSQRYHIKRILTQNEGQSLYAAEDQVSGSEVLVMEITETGGAGMRLESSRVELLAGLQHANLAPVLDHVSVAGQGYYAIVDSTIGQSLRQQLTEGGAFPYTQVVPLLLNLSDVIFYLHDRELPLIHGNIGVDTIFRNQDGKAALLITGFQSGPGTEFTIQGDIYDLGRTAYTLLTNEAPPESGNLEQIKSRMQSNNSQIPPTIAEVIAQSIGFGPEKRFESSEDFKASMLYALVQIPPETLRTSPLSIPMSTPIHSQEIQAIAVTEPRDQPPEISVKPEPTTPIRRRVPWGLL